MKYLGIIKYVLMAISILTFVLYFAGAGDVDLMLKWMYVMLGLAVAAVILLPTYTLSQNPKGAMRSLVGLAIVAVVVGIAFALSSDAPVTTASNVYDNPVGLRITDAGLYTTYFALAAAIVVIVVGEIRNVFK